ncbi:hypothetical protein [Streptomyces sp. A1136]|uniref:hypothetical protein n=1 Tax=Streptomyces sp. A1136 TaxID=2563102 RepID=UPI00109E4D91|nr:hypothetical protein [Streptomyces sp. A1136]THA48337.1 hypothetical protein E6R62_29200 [Streptomyces sp. A1136]
MRFKFGRRIASVAAVAAVAAGALGMSTGNASAAAWDWLSTSNGVGVYSQPHTWSAKVGAPDLFRADGDGVYAYCWTTGDNVGNGNVWYGVSREYYGGSGWAPYYSGYVYGGNTDDNNLFHTYFNNGSWGHC